MLWGIINQECVLAHSFWPMQCSLLPDDIALRHNKGLAERRHAFDVLGPLLCKCSLLNHMRLHFLWRLAIVCWNTVVFDFKMMCKTDPSFSYNPRFQELVSATKPSLCYTWTLSFFPHSLMCCIKGKNRNTNQKFKMSNSPFVENGLSNGW